MSHILKRYDDSQARYVGSVEKHFSIYEFVLIVVAKFYYIIFAALFGAFLSILYFSFIFPPQYTATAKLYVLGQDQITVDVSAMRADTMLAIDYQEVFKTQEVEDAVRSALRQEAWPYVDYNGLTISNPVGTRILYISYTCANPIYAAEIADAYANAGLQFMKESMHTREARIFSNALIPDERDSMGAKGFALTGCILGMEFAVCVLFIIFTLDERPKKPEDIMSTVDIPTFAVIPKSRQKKLISFRQHG